MSFGNTTLSPEQFLSQCDVMINACWQLMKSNGMLTVRRILAEYVPTLESLAAEPSRYQRMAASLMVQTKILQAILAGHDLHYVTREARCMEAVQFGEISGDVFLYLTALGYQGGMHTYNYRQPKRAIDIFSNGMTHLNSDALLNQVDLSVGLAVAHAQNGEEHEALNMIEQARNAMPKHPEQDRLYHIIDFGPSEVDESEGRVYLELHRHFPQKGYALRAYEAYDLTTGKQAVSDRSESRILLHKAEAAIGIGDLGHFAKCLEDGLCIARRIDSNKRKNEARAVLHKAPAEWHKEQVYQDLVKMF